MGSMEGKGSSVLFSAATESCADGSSSIFSASSEVSHDTVHVSRMK